MAVRFKLAGQGAMHMSNPVRPVDYSIDIVQKGYQGFLTQMVVRCLQCWVLAKRVQSWH